KSRENPFARQRARTDDRAWEGLNSLARWSPRRTPRKPSGTEPQPHGKASFGSCLSGAARSPRGFFLIREHSEDHPGTQPWPPNGLDLHGRFFCREDSVPLTRSHAAAPVLPGVMSLQEAGNKMAMKTRRKRPPAVPEETTTMAPPTIFSSDLLT